MKTTIAASVALAACMGTQVIAQTLVKEGTISFALTGQQQVSVSETTGANAGVWADTTSANTPNGPTHYKTGSFKLTQANLIQDIAFVLHGSAGYYGSAAKLVLVQGELSGFFVMTPDLWDTKDNGGIADYNYTDYVGTVRSSDDTDSTTVLGNSTDSLYAALATGRHFHLNPVNVGSIYAYPIGHLQPWGQIYVKYTYKDGTNTYTDYENVTEFFGLTVQECYDCFYLNSFISDANFSFKTITHPQSGPPCCNVAPSLELLGSGKDQYYLTLNFDDTLNNPYLNTNSILYSGYRGVSPTVGAADGILPDVINYTNKIASGIGKPSAYEARFTLNGILTYNWNLKFINSGDAFADFIGTANYTANGYGFIALYCALLTGSASIAETAVKPPTLYNYSPYGLTYWYDTYSDYYSGWFATGNYTDLADTDYTDSLNQNIYFRWLGFTPSTPFNTAANLTYHANYNEAYEPFVAQQQYNSSKAPSE